MGFIIIKDLQKLIEFEIIGEIPCMKKQFLKIRKNIKDVHLN